YATYAHEFSNDSRGLDASLNGIGTPFTFQTQQLGRNFAIVGGSLTMFSGKNFSVQLDSNAEVGRDNYAAYTVDAGLRFHF
ncbi:MAG: autotransporter domain-containing protein, partial [Deltaproteobacteria bacterium]|nr:autotransporter domain-containing protein [Deltaproteobacteria bacterium]